MTFREVMKRLGLWTAAQRETYKVLARMSDHELKDIGLCRNDINRLVEELGDD